MVSSRAERNEGDSGAGCFDWRQNFLASSRNIRPQWFVYTGAAGYGAVLGEIQKNPAVAAAGS